MSAHLPPPASVSSPEAVSAAHAVVRPRWRRPALLAVSLAALAGAWTLGVGVWLPHALQPRLLAAAEEALGVPVQIQGLTVSPWRLNVRLSGVQLGASEAPVLRIGAVEAQVSLASLWHRAPVLRRLHIDAPELLLTRLDEGRLNISPILARLQARAADAPASDAPARFAVFNISLDGGLIRYEDRVLGQTHTVDRLRVGLPFLSSLPSQVDVAVEPLLEARVNGSTLRLAGTTLPFQAGHRSEVKVAWRDVELAAWLPHARPWLPAEWAAVADAGRLSTDLTLSFAQPTDAAAPELAVRGQLVLTDLALRLPHAPGVGQVQLGWRSLMLGGLDLQPLVQRANVGRVALDGLTLTARPVAAARAARSKAPPAPAVTVRPAGPPAALADATPRWQWAVGELVASASRIDAQTERAAPWPVLRAVQLEVKGLSSDAGAAPARWQLALQDDAGGRAQAQGEWQLSQGRGHASLRLDEGAIVPWLRPLAGRLALPLTPTAGSLSLQAKASLQRGSAWQVQLSDTALQVSGFAAQAASGRDRLAWRTLAAEGVRFDATATGQPGTASVASVTFDGLNVDWTRPETTQAAGAGEAAAPARDGPQWSVGRLACADCRVSVRDASTVPAAQVDLTQLQLSIEGASHDAARPMKVTLDTRAQGPGRVRFDGEVRRAPVAVQGRVEVQSLDLRVLQAYLAPHLNVQLASAQAQAAGRLVLGMGAKPDSLSLRYRGRLGLDRVQLLDKVNEAEFLRWRRLALEGTDLNWREGQVQADLGRIALQDAYGRIILQPDGRLNLASIVRQSGDADAAPTSITTPEAATAPAITPFAEPLVSTSVTPTAPRSPATTAPSEAPSLPMDLRWRGIQLRNAQVDFTDTFIRPSYSARLTRLSGTVSGVAARQPAPAELMLTGAVDDGAPLSIKGTLHPLGPKLFTDIEGEARGVELTRMSPYAARHAGYAIERGTLSVNVRYKVEDGRLAATNRLFLDQLTFGEPSGDPQATRLPVRLAVALLKNSRGEIDINLPISGSLDDPQFSVGGILWRVVANLVTKAVTAPFALLMGGDSDEAGEVPFAAGEATLSDAARQRLDAMGTRLADRPALKLDAIGHAHAAVDADGLREAHVMRLMRVAKSRALGVPLDEAVISADERDRWLAAAYRAADIRKPRNAVGLPKTLPPGEQLALIKAAAPVDAAALRALADRRADAVKAYLIERLPADRVRLGASVVQAEAQPLPATPPPGVRFAVR